MIYLEYLKFYNILSRGLLPLLLVPLLMLYNGASKAESAQEIGNLSLNGTLIEDNDHSDRDCKDKDNSGNINCNISAIVTKGELLVAGSDEGADVLIFKKTNDLKYTEAEHVCIPLDGKKCGEEREGSEIDIEGLAWGNEYLYIIGSHSVARKKVKSGNSLEENIKRLETLKHEPTRDQLFRVKLDEYGKIIESSKIKKISLRNLLINHRLLSLFTPIPSKENGIDIEGLAVGEINGKDHLYIGFRGPVLRGNHALVMVLAFKKDKFEEKKIKKNYPKMNYLNLNGRGIRGMAELESGGFLLLAGPVGDARIGDENSRYQLFFWDGKDNDLSGVSREALCDIPAPNGIKAEGIELLNKGRQASDDYHFVIVYDGAKKGNATVYSCKAK